jgi:hypothetical protein
MSKLVKVNMPNGGYILMEATENVEIDATNQQAETEKNELGTTKVTSRTASKAINNLDFGQISSAVVNLANELQGAFRQTQSTKVAVEFGIQIGAETNGISNFFIKGSGNAAIKVTIEWQTSNEVGAQATLSQKDLTRTPNDNQY